MKKSTRFIGLFCALLLLVSAFAGCANKAESSGANAGGASAAGQNAGGNSGEVDLSQEVHLVYYLWGGEGVANKDILEVVNSKLKEDLNCTIEVKYIDWSDIGAKYPLLLTSGEEFDMIHTSPTATPSYYTLASQDLLVDITDMLDLVPTLRDEIPEKTWASATYKGRIYGVPTLYSEFTPDGYAYRDDLLKKYNLEPITDINSWVAYMDAIAKNESFAPINGTVNDAIGMYHMFVDSTKKWLFAPGIGYDSLHFVAESPEDYKNVFHPAYTDEFKAWVEQAKDWSDKGYWPKDVMASETGGKDNFINGLAGGFITHMPDWTGAYGTYKDRLPGVNVDWWSPAEQNHKVINKPGVDNSTGISVTSKNPERALMVIEKFMTDPEYYCLMQYGIEGRQYEVVDGLSRQPESYDEDVDAGGFAVWSLRNDRLNIPYASEDPRRYELIEKWKTEAIDSPYVGFTFEPAKVSNELAAIGSVNASLGRQLMLGKVADVDTALKEYQAALEKAGIETVLEELRAQLENWTPLS